MAEDSYVELRKSGLEEFAADLVARGIVSHASIVSQNQGRMGNLTMTISNTFKSLFSGSFSQQQTTQPVLPAISSPLPHKAPSRCPPVKKCRYLHLCVQKKPSAVTQLEYMHICKDTKPEELLDVNFFRALRTRYHKSRSLWERMVFKLKQIDFVEVSLSFCPTPTARERIG